MIAMARPIDNLIQFIVQRRSKLGLSQRDLNDASDLNTGAVANIEMGRVTKAPSMDTLSGLAQGLRVDVDILYRVLDGRIDDVDLLMSLARKSGHVSLTDAVRVAGVTTARDLGQPTKAGKLPPLASFIYSKRSGMPVADLARMVGVAPELFDHIDAGHVPPRETLARIAAALGVTTDEIAAATKRRAAETKSALATDAAAQLALLTGPKVGLPYFGRVGCGEFLNVEGEPIALRDVPVALLGDLPVEDAAALEAWGDSMNQAGILPGMTIVFIKTDRAEPGQIVIATVPFQGTTCKRFEKRADGFYLVAESTGQYPDIKLGEGITIDGVVKYAWSFNQF